MKTSHAIILVAGEGKRLLPFTNTNPKCFVEVKGVTILENALDLLSKNNIQTVRIVIGHLKNIVRDKIGLNYKGMNIEYITNDNFHSTNSMYSLYLGLDDVVEPTWVLEGDVFFEEKILKMPIKSNFSWFVDSSMRELDGAYIKSDKGGRAISLQIIKNGNKLEDDLSKSIGILHLCIDGVLKLKDWLSAGVQARQTNLYYDLIVDEHLMEIFVELIDVSGAKWFEIDTNDDLEKAKRLFK